MKDSEILALRNVLLIPDTIEETKRVIQLLWSELLNSPWKKEDFEYLEKRNNYYRSTQDELAIEISKEGKCFWTSLNYYKGQNYFKDFTIIYLKSNKTMESRNISVTLEQAREWYNSGITALRTLALNVWAERELGGYEYIKSCVDKDTVNLTIPQGDVCKVLANGKLAIIAKHFNGPWEMNAGKTGYFISKSCMDGIAIYEHKTVQYASIVYFKNAEDAKKAIKMLGADIRYLF